MLMGALRRLFQEVVVPELEQLRAEGAEIRTTLQLTNKRLDDFNSHLIDLSRRIDALREELTQRLDETNTRIDTLREQLTQRIDAVRTDLTQRLDETNTRIEAVRADLIRRHDETNDRLNRLYEVIVRREEHEGLAQRLTRLEQKVEELAARHAA